MNRIVEMVTGPLWLHLEDDWGFFWRGPYIARAADILAENENIGQVAFNPSYAETLEDRQIDAGGSVEPQREAGRTAAPVRRRQGRAASRTDDVVLAALRASAFADPNASHRLNPSVRAGWALRARGGQRYAEAGNRTAFFDQVVALHPGRMTWERGPPSAGAPTS